MEELDIKHYTTDSDAGFSIYLNAFGGFHYYYLKNKVEFRLSRSLLKYLPENFTYFGYVKI
jgi:hypothetical protein